MPDAAALALDGWRTKKQRVKKHAPVLKPPLEPLTEPDIEMAEQQDVTPTGQHGEAMSGVEEAMVGVEEAQKPTTRALERADAEDKTRDQTRPLGKEPSEAEEELEEAGEETHEACDEAEDLPLERAFVPGSCVDCGAPSNGSSQVCTGCRLLLQQRHFAW